MKRGVFLSLALVALSLSRGCDALPPQHFVGEVTAAAAEALGVARPEKPPEGRAPSVAAKNAPVEEVAAQWHVVHIQAKPTVGAAAAKSPVTLAHARRADDSASVENDEEPPLHLRPPSPPPVATSEVPPHSSPPPLHRGGLLAAARTAMHESTGDETLRDTASPRGIGNVGAESFASRAAATSASPVPSAAPLAAPAAKAVATVDAVAATRRERGEVARERRPEKRARAAQSPRSVGTEAAATPSLASTPGGGPAAASHAEIGARPTDSGSLARTVAAEAAEAAEGGIVARLFARLGATVFAALACGASASLLGSACLVLGFFVSSAMWRRSRHGAIRKYIERLPVCRAPDIERRLPARSGYDCTFSKPLSSKQLVRLEGYVEQPLSGSLLTAPLTQRTCVLYTSVASRQVLDGLHPVPEAFACASVNFFVSIAGAPNVHVEVRGKDVSLFDMCDGCFAVERSEDHVPEGWQDFISAHRTAPHLSLRPRQALDCNRGTLEFQESTLRVGALVSLVGELHRDADGTLALRPWAGDAGTPSGGAARGFAGAFGAKRELWRTSWEAACQPAHVDSDDEALDPKRPGAAARPPAEPRFEKVLVSDDRRLFTGAGDAGAFEVPCSRNLLRDVFSPWGSGCSAAERRASR